MVYMHIHVYKEIRFCEEVGWCRQSIPDVTYKQQRLHGFQVHVTDLQTAGRGHHLDLAWDTHLYGLRTFYTKQVLLS